MECIIGLIRAAVPNLSSSSRTVPVKLAYTSYESIKENEQDAKGPIIIMHGLFGSKNNWNSLSKAIHQKTKRKVVLSSNL